MHRIGVASWSDTPMTLKGHEFSRYLKEGRYTSLGSYPRFLVMTDGGCLCINCARSEAVRIRAAAMAKWDDGWRPLAFEVNWEDPELLCDHCGERIESAYAEPDA